LVLDRHNKDDVTHPTTRASAGAPAASLMRRCRAMRTAPVT